MVPDLTFAYAAASVLAGLILLGIILLAYLKIRNGRIERETGEVLDRYSDYFQYLQAHLDKTEPLQPPPGIRNIRERLILEKKLAELLECLKGRQHQRLADLCRRMGLVDYHLRRLQSRLHGRRIDAAYHLGIYRAPEAVPRLLELLDAAKFDSSLLIIARSLARCARDRRDLREMARKLARHRRNQSAFIVDLLSEWEGDFVSLFAEFLQEKEIDLVKIALLGLAEHVEPGMVEQLQKLMKVPERDLRIKVVQALLRAGNILSEELIIRLLGDEIWEIRAAAAKAIGPMGEAAYIPLLKKSMSDAHWWVRYNSALSLSLLDEPGFFALCEIAQEQGEQPAGELAFSFLQETLHRLASSPQRAESAVAYSRLLHLYQQHFGSEPQHRLAK